MTRGKKPKKWDKAERNENKRQWDGDKAPAIELALPHAHTDMDINALLASDTLEDLLEGPILPRTNTPYTSPRERKACFQIRSMYRTLRETYEGLLEGEPKIERVYEIKYVGPLLPMFSREDGREIRWVTKLEAELVHLLMHEVHSMAIRSISWYDIACRLGIDIYRLKRLWGRYQKCIELYDVYGEKSVVNMHFQRCEYVLSRLMRLAEKNDNVQSWLAVSKALEPIAKIAQDTSEKHKVLDAEKKLAIERIKLMFERQRSRWIEEGKSMERKDSSIEVNVEPKTRFLTDGEEMPPEYEEIGDI